MTNQRDDIEALKEEVEELDFRLYRIESFLSSSEAESSVPPILDDSFNEAAELLKDQEYVTTLGLQRRLETGFTRASRIIDQLEFMKWYRP